MKRWITIIATLVFALSAQAQTAKEVVIVNELLAVVCKVPQLLGFTSATYTGYMGGHFGVTKKCQQEFPESRMCTLEEVAATIAIPAGLSGVAWIHKGRNYGAGAIFDAYVIGDGCLSWTDADQNRVGPVVDTDGGWSTTSARCSESRPIACCGVK